MKSVAVACLLAAVGAQDWDYSKNGENWGSITTSNYGTCNSPGGSPIDLKADFQAAGYESNEVDKFDKLTAQFSNQAPATIAWADYTTHFELSTGVTNFQSDIGKNVLGAHTNEWSGKHVCFRSPSEHTVDGARHDLEFQTLFNAVPFEDAYAYKHAGLSIFFSVNAANVKLSHAEQLIIDTFFETLDWSKPNPTTANLVTYGDLMSLVNLKNRWVYRGSTTTPPCTPGVYWNVLHTVYPIKRKHLDQFKAKYVPLINDGKIAGDPIKGNWRMTQELKATHAVSVVTETTLGSERDTANDINYNININIYNQNVGGQCGASQ